MHQEIKTRLDGFTTAAVDLLSAWERLGGEAEGEACGDCLTDEYPFRKSFDEIVADLIEWRDANTADSDFVRFRNTRRYVPNLKKHIDGIDFLLDEHAKGYLYEGDLYIHILDDGQFELVLLNADYLSYDLEELERRLYEFANEEDVWPPKAEREAHIAANPPDDDPKVNIVLEVERQEREGYEAWDRFERSPLIDALRKAFVRALRKQDRLYHLDDDATDIGNSVDGHFLKCFTQFEGEALNEIRDALYGDPRKGGERLHDLCIKAQAK
jgi:hypothetical protein